MCVDETDALSVTVNTRFTEPVSPSVTLGELIENVISLSIIVPVPLAVAMPAPPVALLSEITTVSFPSCAVSPVTGTVIVLLVSFAANVSVLPVIAV